MEMVDLRQPADKSNQNKLPVIWHAYASGPVSYTHLDVYKRQPPKDAKYYLVIH